MYIYQVAVFNAYLEEVQNINSNISPALLILALCAFRSVI